MLISVTLGSEGLIFLAENRFLIYGITPRLVIRCQVRPNTGHKGRTKDTAFLSYLRRDLRASVVLCDLQSTSRFG